MKFSPNEVYLYTLLDFIELYRLGYSTTIMKICVGRACGDLTTLAIGDYTINALQAQLSREVGGPSSNGHGDGGGGNSQGYGNHGRNQYGNGGHGHGGGGGNNFNDWPSTLLTRTIQEAADATGMWEPRQS